MDKAQFIKELEPVVIMAVKDVIQLEYFEQDYNDEVVKVFFEDGDFMIVDVTEDSLVEIMLDVADALEWR